MGRSDRTPTLLLVPSQNEQQAAQVAQNKPALQGNN